MRWHIRPFALATLGALLLATTAAQAQTTVPAPPAPPTPPSPISETLGSIAFGVAWQITELDINTDADCCTTSMSNGLQATPIVYAQIPVRMLLGGANGIGYTVRAGYRQFELREQDLGTAPMDMQDYGTRVSGHALYAMPFLVARIKSEQRELSSGLGLGLAHVSAKGEILVRRFTAGPPFVFDERQSVRLNTLTSALGAFVEYRIGPIVAAMETAIMLPSKGGTSYDIGVSAFTLAWRANF